MARKIYYVVDTFAHFSFTIILFFSLVVLLFNFSADIYGGAVVPRAVFVPVIRDVKDRSHQKQLRCPINQF